MKADTNINASFGLSKRSIISLSSFSMEDPALAKIFRVCFVSMIIIMNLTIFIGHIYFGRFFGDGDFESPKREMAKMNGFLNYLKETSAFLPINDLRISKTQCPKNYSEENLGEYRLYKACTGVGIFSTNDSLPLFCPKGARHPMDELTIGFGNWKGKKICVTRSSSIKRISNSSKCPSNYKDCSLTLCVPKMEKCPLTKLSIIEFENAEETVSVDDLKLYLHRNFDENPIPIGKVYIASQEASCRSKNVVPACNEESNPFPQEGKYISGECVPYGFETQQTVVDFADAKDVLSWNIDLSELEKSNPLLLAHINQRGEFALVTLPLKYHSCPRENFELIDSFNSVISETHWYFHLYYQITVNWVTFSLLMITMCPIYLFVIKKTTNNRKNFANVSLCNMIMHLAFIVGGFVLLFYYLPQAKQSAQTLARDLGDCYEEEGVKSVINDVFRSDNSDGVIERLGKLKSFAIYLIIVSFTGLAVDVFGIVFMRNQA